MSKFERTNEWIALLTNVGVLFGIFVLIYEVRQNTISIENQTDVAIQEIGHSHASLIVADPDLATIFLRSATEPWNSFSPLEQVRIGIFWTMLVDRVSLQRRLFERHGDRLTRENIVFPEQVIRSESFRAWWGEAKQDGTYPKHFQEFFDAYIDSVLSDP